MALVLKRKQGSYSDGKFLYRSGVVYHAEGEYKARLMATGYFAETSDKAVGGSVSAKKSSAPNAAVEAPKAAPKAKAKGKKAAKK